MVSDDNSRNFQPPSTPTLQAEGVIKFNLEFQPARGQAYELVAELSAWRRLLYLLGLTGRDAFRYDGLAYGNVSTLSNTGRFIVSGTGTGAKEWLDADDFCLVLDFELENNFLRAEGPVQPSSEALTHAAIYNANPQARSVFHVHAPEIWRNARGLGLYVTDRSIAYGTPEMGKAIGGASTGSAGIIAMGGHEDGIVSFGDNTESAALMLLKTLTRAIQMDLAAGLIHYE